MANLGICKANTVEKWLGVAPSGESVEQAGAVPLHLHRGLGPTF